MKYLFISVNLLILSTILTPKILAMRSSDPFWEKDAAVDKDKWSIYDLKGKKRESKARIALFDAIINGQQEIVELLVKKGVDINTKEKSGWTALHWAIHYDRKKIAKFLIEHGADVNAKTTDGYGRTPLSIALNENLLDIAKMLINKGADIKTETDEGMSILSVAIRNNQTKLAKLMIQKNVFLMGCPRSTVFPLIIAKRGDSANYPENTIPAIESAIKEGCPIISVDIQLTKDNKIVVIHDSTLNRTTSGSGEVKNYTLKELKELDAGSWFDSKFKDVKIPTLIKVFKKVKNKAIINIVISKTINHDQKLLFAKHLINTIKDNYKLNNVIISSFNYQLLRDLRVIEPKVNLAILNETKDKNSNIINLVKAIDAVFYFPESSMVDKKMVTKLHKGGVLVIPWAKDNEKEKKIINRLKDFYIDGFWTKDPKMLKTIFNGGKLQNK